MRFLQHFLLLSILCIDALKLNSVENPGQTMNLEEETSSLLTFSSEMNAADHEMVKKFKNYGLNMTRVPSELMHNVDLADEQRMWGIREGSTFSWKEQRLSLNKAKHSWCFLVRDNWSCSGQRYEEVLKTMVTPDAQNWRLESWPRGTRFFGEGNSYFAQLIYTIVCESDVEIYKFENGNSLYAYSSVNDASILLFDNDPLNLHTQKTIHLLKDVQYDPTVISLGSLNTDPKERTHMDRDHRLKNLNERQNTYMKAFSATPVIPYGEQKGGSNCEANFLNCVKGGSHQCIPGPISSHAALFVNIIQGGTPNQTASEQG